MSHPHGIQTQALSFIPTCYSPENNKFGCYDISAIKTYAIYKKGILVLEEPVNLPDHTRVEIVIQKKFSEFVKTFGDPEAKADIEQILQMNRRRKEDA